VIILDTDVFSALMKGGDDRAIEKWLNRNSGELFWTTTITIFEIRTGIELLANERRKQKLEVAFVRCLREDLENRIFDFDRDAAVEAASMAARRRLIGAPLEIRDNQIAGIVASRRTTLATRNTRHFENLGIELVDPWANR
jgi:toxin FitB